ncbi:MAG: hypothetical protein F6K54_14545 [Okeania sp. SIO3B5]|uniref:transposase n=1 Tax=Okeania sp. SIO3B5 TaxID=2607811 RepID=UPI0013FF4097|nr:transposase [Okeania sp. SIO3B5]NEO54193.1 hypothetical protein [Okeania sp. SIO3B5]
MLLVTHNLIKKNHSLFADCDSLSFLTKNLYNTANYLCRQNFFNSKTTNANTVYYQLKNSHDYLVWPSKVSQEIIRMFLKEWQGYYSAYREYKAFPSKFKALPKIPNYQGSAGDRSNGRYVVSYNN